MLKEVLEAHEEVFRLLATCKQENKAQVGCLRNSSECVRVSLLCTSPGQSESVVAEGQACETASVATTANSYANSSSYLACWLVRLVIFCQRFSRWTTEKLPHAKTVDYVWKVVSIFTLFFPGRTGTISLIWMHFPCRCCMWFFCLFVCINWLETVSLQNKNKLQEQQQNRYIILLASGRHLFT